MTSTKVTKRARRHARVRAKLSGTAQRPRLVIYRSLTHNYAQLVDDETGKTLASSSDIKAKGKNKTESAKEVGKEIAKKAAELKISSCVFDKNGFKYHGRVKAIADSAREGGLQF